MRRASLISAFGILLACHPRTESAYRNAPIILISIDTLRSDHLPVYGYRRVDTPRIDAFRKDAILFRHAYSHSPMTLPSHASMLTGLLPADHGVRNNIGYRLDAQHSGSLPCLLRHSGYSTAAAVSSYVLRSESGIDGCFDEYDDAIDPGPRSEFSDYQRAGGLTLMSARRWIDGVRGKPFFFFFHVYEPHVPYEPPEPFRNRYASAYDGEIAHADSIVGQFLDHLRDQGIYDHAIIILTSDHGEGLGDHGEEQHSILLYREAIQVPLLMKLPRGARGSEVVERPVQLIDLYPTVLTLLGLEGPARSGTSLTADQSSPHHSIFSETLYPRIHLGWSDLASIVTDRFHYIHGPRPELYDLVADPRETRNIINSERRRAASFRKMVESFQRPMAPVGEVDPEAARRLAALGYVGSIRTSTESDLRNPVDNIHELETLRSGLMLANQSQPFEAERLLGELLRRNPWMVEGWLKLAEVASAQGRYDIASDAFREAIARSPVISGDVLVQAGHILLKRQRLDEAEKHASEAVLDVPEKAHQLLAHIALARGDVRRAEQEARASIETTNPQPSTLVTLAEVLQKKGQLHEALHLLDQAEERAHAMGLQKVYALEYLRGDTWARLGNATNAMAAHQKEIAVFPDHLEAYSSLAVLHFINSERGKVERTLQTMVERNRSQRAYAMAVKTMKALEDLPGSARWRQRCAAAGFDCPN